MYEIEKSYTFEAGHSLEHHDGKCKGPHGHSYTLIVRISSAELQQEGPKKNMVVDFGDISNVVKPMIEGYFDHQWLNDTLSTDSPTVEFIAKWIFDHLSPKLPGLYGITVHETASSRVTYAPTS